MSPQILQKHKVSVRLAETEAEIREAQNVRYRVFYQEYGAKAAPDILEAERDFDAYDAHADHLIVLDQTGDHEVIVGTYRLFPAEAAKACGQFYSSDEFDVRALEQSGQSLLELGRSCVLPQYRTKPVVQLLWQGIAQYITDRNIDIMFGCASFHTTDVQAVASSLSYLYHYHLCPHDIIPVARADRYVDMNIVPKDKLNARREFAALPPLLKGYLRLGGSIGDGAVIDNDFNTIDVCILVETEALSDRYRKHYERKLNQDMPGKAV